MAWVTPTPRSSRTGPSEDEPPTGSGALTGAAAGNQPGLTPAGLGAGLLRLATVEPGAIFALELLQKVRHRCGLDLL